MKIKKLLTTMIAIMIFGSIALYQNIVLAAEGTLYFGVTELRASGFGYAIGNPSANGSTEEQARAAKIWNIVQYSAQDAKDPKETNLFCVKAGVGFSDTKRTEEYNVSYDMRTQRTNIAAQNDTLKGLVEGGHYDQLLALTELLYVKGESAETEKTQLLEAAQITLDRWDGKTLLTDDEIQVVEQAAIWYFTNYGEENNKYNKYDSEQTTSWLWYTQDGTTYTNLADYNPTNVAPGIAEGKIRQEQAETLYKYLIKTAIEKAEQGSFAATTKLTLYASTTNGQAQPLMKIEKNPAKFDLALRKYITKINGEELAQEESRVPVIDASSLKEGNATTATYKHRKDPKVVATGDKVTYKLTIYNEGDKDGRATKIIDQLPTGLKFLSVISGNFEVESFDEEGNNRLVLKRKDDNTTNLKSYASMKETAQDQTTAPVPDSETIEIECEVTLSNNATNRVLTNVAWIAEEYDAVSQKLITNQTEADDVYDRDSEPATKPKANQNDEVNKDNIAEYKGSSNNQSDLSDSNYFYEGQQDDDDFEKLILDPQEFDLKLIKRITQVNNQNVPERIQDIDVSKLNIEGEGAAKTATYKMNKEPVSVATGDIVTYTFRVYNEGMIDGYAQEITEDIPEGLEFLWSEKEGEELKNDTSLTENEKEAIEFNQNNLWGNFQYDENKEKIIAISTDYLSKENEATPNANLIKAFGKNDGNKTKEDLSYKEVSVKLKVISQELSGKVLRNEAEISKDADAQGNEVIDRDSDTNKWGKENDDKYYDEDKKWPVYKEDDEDYDNIILQSFDLALRKFIIAISKDETIEETEYLKNEDGSYKREPVVDTSKLNTKTEDGKTITTANYNHTKEPVLVQKNDTIIYMLRVYNEGDVDGYASEIKDHLPANLAFVEGEFNKEYGWEVSEDGRTVTTKYLADKIIEKAKTENDQIVLAYQEVPIMCKVKDSAISNENITNIADITEYLDVNKKPATDRDSQSNNIELPSDKDLPNYKGDETGSYIPGQQDDDDFEKVVVKEFDLALRKWVTQAIVIENGKETVSQTGHEPWDDPEGIVKVELHRKKLDKVTVKFRYSIRVYNQGDLEGYAKEITDYIPEGLKFIAEDNPGWTDEGNNVISTRLLENTLLKPGEYADVEVLLTWINGQDNIGLKTNTAEISEDYNEYGVPDKDSTPDNQKPGEDDIDDAPVMLSISTGQERIYFTLGFTILITLGAGTFLIKKYVL